MQQFVVSFAATPQMPGPEEEAGLAWKRERASSGGHFESLHISSAYMKEQLFLSLHFDLQLIERLLLPWHRPLSVNRSGLLRPCCLPGSV